MPAAPPIEHLPWFLMLSLAMSKPWRQTEGMLRSIIQMLGLDLPVPDHTTLSRRSISRDNQGENGATIWMRKCRQRRAEVRA